MGMSDILWEEDVKQVEEVDTSSILDGVHS